MRKFWLSSLVVGMILLGVSLYGIFGPEKEYKTTTGVITKIVESYDSIDDQTSYTVYINYSVNSKEYKDVEYGAYSSSMKVGNEVIVYYAIDDPTFIQAEGYQKVPYIVGVGALIIVIYSVFKFIRP